MLYTINNFNIQENNMRKLHILYHIDELARDAIVASAMKRVSKKYNIEIYFTTKRLSRILRLFNGFDAVILPSLQHYKYFFPSPQKLPNNIFILPSEAVGQATGTLRRMQAKYFGNNEIESIPWHQSVKGFLLWGEVHKEGLVANEPKYSKKSFVVGHPRLSKWCKAYKKQIKNNSKQKTIGFVSRFCGINPFDQRGNMQYMRNAIRFFEEQPRWENSSSELDAEDIFYTELIDFRLFMMIIHSLNPNDYKFKIRPHPREDRNQWKKLKKNSNLNIEISKWDHPFTYWLNEVDKVICPPSTSIYDMLYQDYHPICIDKIIKKRKNHILAESDDNNRVLDYVCRPESLEELIEIIEQDISTKPIDGYQSIINGQIKSNLGDDSTKNILKVISQNTTPINSKDSLKQNIKLLCFKTFSFIYTHISYLKNFYKSEQGSTFYLTIWKKMWIKKLSYIITKGSIIK
tara:strand:+ start:1444 stop:2826 length:1383 start_codon:yes stop_codon:yes gene_type:complete